MLPQDSLENIKKKQMKKITIFIILIVLLFIGSCEKQEFPCDNVHTQRIGARCNDGTKSDATGSGACSNHGGVKYWICK